MATLVDVQPPASYFTDRHRGRKTPTRNTKNKYIGAKIRQSIEQVFNGLDGWEGMMRWAKENQTVFYSQVVPKLLPAELAESGLAGHITVIVQRNPNQSSPTVIDTTTGSETVQIEAKAEDEKA